MPDRPALSLIILPFKNLSENVEARATVMPLVYEEVLKLGVLPVREDSVRAFLRRARIRETGQINWADAQQIGAESGTPWILLGSIDLYSAANPAQVGFSARLLNGLTGDVVWADSRYATSEDNVVLLGLGRIDSTQRLAAGAIESLIKSLGESWLQRPSDRHGINLQNVARPRIIIMPFDNATGVPGLAQFAGNVALSILYEHHFDVVEPGMVNEQLLSHDVLPQGQIDGKTLAALADHFAADYCFTGTISEFGATESSETGTLPSIDIETRLLDAASGSLIWAGCLERSGGDYAGMFQLGAVRSPGTLMQKMFRRLLKSLITQLELQKDHEALKE